MEKSIRNLIWLVYVFYLFTIIIFGDRAGYHYYSNLTFIALIALMIFFIVRKSLIVPVRLFIFLPFVLYSFLSLLWSYVPDSTLERSITLLRLFVLFVVMSFYLYLSNETYKFIIGIAVSSIFILVYVLAFYGYFGLSQMMNSGLRVGGEFVNSNTLAIYLSLAVVVFYYQFLKNHKWYYLLFVILLVLIIASTGSKKGIIDLVVGFILITGFNQSNSDKTKMVFRIAVILSFVGFVFSILWQTSMFSTVRTRFEDMFGMLLGTGNSIDYSTLERQVFIEAGFRQFFETPFLGIGIGSTSYITKSVVGQNTYLHNEYVELLASGGLFGSFLYFVPILLLLKWNYKYRRTSSVALLVTVTLIIFFVNGWAAVQYFSKISYVIFAISLASCLSLNKESYTSTDELN